MTKKLEIKDLKSSLLYDFDRTIEYLCTNNPKLTNAKEVFPIQALIDLNQIVTSPHELSLRPQQEHYPFFSFIYYLTINSKLFKKQKEGKIQVLQKTDYLDIYNTLNDTEKYFYLLEVWWCHFNWNNLYNFGLFEELETNLSVIVNALRTNSVNSWINLNEIKSSNKIKSLGRNLLLSFEYFGLFNVKFENKKSSSYEICNAIMFNESGNKIIEKLYEKRNFNNWNNYAFEFDEKNTKLEDEAFITTFKELFVKGELEHTIKKEQRIVKGTYTFKVSYEKAYAMFKVNSKITLEELHDIIQEIIRFDNDHLYCFYIEDEMGSLNTYVSPEDMGNKYTDEIKIEELGLWEGKTFEYLFDYGDEWVFSIKVEKIDTIGVKIEEPLLMKIKGKFPEQYDF